MISVYADIGPPGTNFFFHYTPDTVLGFDYWVAEGTTQLLIEVNTYPSGNYDYWIKNPVIAEWAHAEVKLADMVAMTLPSHVLDQTDKIMQVGFYLNRPGGKPFYLDNIQAIDLEHGVIERGR